jgi:hypothetical protein
MRESMYSLSKYYPNTIERHCPINDLRSTFYVWRGIVSDINWKRYLRKVVQKLEVLFKISIHASYVGDT